MHLLEIFGGIGLGVLRAAMAAGLNIRFYTYVDHDAINRRIAREVLRQLQLEYLDQVPNAAVRLTDGSPKVCPW